MCDLEAEPFTHNCTVHTRIQSIAVHRSPGAIAPTFQVDPDPSLIYGYCETPMDSAASKAHLAVVKHQATMPNKKGDPLRESQCNTMYGGLGVISYVEAFQVDLGVWN